MHDPVATRSADFRLLGEQIRAAMARCHVPGVAVGVLCGDQVFTEGFGVTSVDHPLPVDSRTLFQVGSISKTVTATAAMRLVEAGRLALDAPVRRVLPDLRLSRNDVAERVTLRHLFTHTGGWEGDFFGDFDPGDDALAKYVTQMAHLPQRTPLGAVWSYNNAGFSLAGRVIEVVVGKPFEMAVKELVFDPLGMARSFFFTSDIITHRFVVGHEVVDGKPVVTRPWPVTRATHAAGGVVSCVEDMLKYARFHLGDGASDTGAWMLNPETLALMHAPAVRAGCFADAVGISWWVDDIGGTRIVRHEGATNGQKAALVLAPGHQFALVALTNCDAGGELLSETTAWALKRFLGVEKPEPALLELPARELAAFAGRYGSTLFEVTLAVQDAQLWLQLESKGGFPTKDSPPPAEPLSPRMRLGFYDHDRVIVIDPPMKGERGEFLRDPDGEIAWFRFWGRVNRPLARPM